MISKNYKKVAIIQKDTRLTLKEESWVKQTITMDLEFAPKILLVRFFEDKEDRETVIDSTVHNGLNNCTDGYSVNAYINNISKSSFTVNFHLDLGRARITINQIIAIE